MNLYRNLFILLLLTSACIFTSCEENTGCTDPNSINFDPDAESSDGSCRLPELRIHFHPTVNGQDLSFRNTYEVNGVSIRFSVAQFYVSGLQLSGGNTTDEPGKYLLVQGSQHMYDAGEISKGSKSRLTFNVGVDSLTNHSDPTTYPADHPLAPKNPSMHWNWDAGYQFIKLEGLADADGDGTPEAPFEYHIGKDSNLRNISLSIDMEVASETNMINVMIDYAGFLNGLDLTSDLISHTGDFPVIAKTIADNAPSVFMFMP
ncbi:MAG: MbnP family protein [Bacteroidota bacterium]